MKKFAVFDIDGTIFRWQLYHELFDALVAEGSVTGEDATRVLDAREKWRKRHLEYHQYEDVLVDVMEQVIIGLSAKRFHEIADDILLKKGHRTYKYTLDLARDLQKKGYIIIAISASHQQLVEAFCKLHHIDIAVGRKFEVVKGKLSEKSDSVYGRKHILLRQIVKERGLSWENSYAVGDSEGDISMLEVVENPIAFNPNTQLREVAMQHGWPIVLERKSLVYRLEKDLNGTYVLA